MDCQAWTSHSPQTNKSGTWGLQCPSPQQARRTRAGTVSLPGALAGAESADFSPLCAVKPPGSDLPSASPPRRARDTLLANSLQGHPLHSLGSRATPQNTTWEPAAGLDTVLPLGGKQLGPSLCCWAHTHAPGACFRVSTHLVSQCDLHGLLQPKHQKDQQICAPPGPSSGQSLLYTSLSGKCRVAGQAQPASQACKLCQPSILPVPTSLGLC